MSAPLAAPTQGTPIGGNVDFQGFQAKRLRLFDLGTGSITTASGDTPVDGMIAYGSQSGAKRIKFYDSALAADVFVPRLDYNENVTVAWNFTIATGTNPFTVTSTTKVANLNADKVDGYDTAEAATASTLAARDSNARIKAADPSATDDVVTLGYLTGYVAGIRDPKDAARIATTATLVATRTSNTLTADANGSINSSGIDGVTDIAVNDRVLVKNQTTAKDRGVYIVTDLGSASTPWIMQRSSDADTSAEVTNGLSIWITAGTTNAQSGWLLTTADPITLNTTSLTFVQNNGATQLTAGNGIDITGNTVSVKVGGSTTYTAGAFVYHGTTSTLSSAQLTGIIKGNTASAPTAVLPGTTSGVTSGTITKFSSASPYLVDSLITESGSTITVTGALTVTSTTTLATALTGLAKIASGVVSVGLPGTTSGMTAGTISKFSSSSPFVVDSIMTESASVVTVTGGLTVTGTSTLATSLTGILKGASGVVSSVSGTAGTIVKWGTNTLADSVITEASSVVTIGTNAATWDGNATGVGTVIVGAFSATNNGGNLRVNSTTTMAVDKGGSIALGGTYISTTNAVDYAQISGRKENSTSGNASGYFVISTRDDSLGERDWVKVSSAGLATFSGAVTIVGTTTVATALTGLATLAAGVVGRVLPGTTSGMTVGTIPKFSSSTPFVTDSIMTEASGVVTLTADPVGLKITRTTAETLSISVADTYSLIKHIEDGGDPASGYGNLIFETNAASNSDGTRGGFIFRKTGGSTYLNIQNSGTVIVGSTIALSTGVLQVYGGLTFNGAQTIQTTTGTLTLSTGAANGNIAFSAHGTGRVAITQSASITDGFTIADATSTTKSHLGTFGSDIYFFNNYYYNGAHSTDDSSKASTGIIIGIAGISLQYAPASATPSRSTGVFMSAIGAVGVGTTSVGAVGTLTVNSYINGLAGFQLNGGASSGTILRANGTAYIASTSTFADTYAVSRLLYASSANVVAGLATANSSVLVTDGSGVPSLSTSLPAGTTIASVTISRKVSGVFASGASSYTVTHSLSAQTITVRIYKITTGQTWIVDYANTDSGGTPDANKVTVAFGFTLPDIGSGVSDFGYVITG